MFRFDIVSVSLQIEQERGKWGVMNYQFRWLSQLIKDKQK